MALRERVQNEIWNVIDDGSDNNLQIVAAKILKETDGVEIVPFDSDYPDKDVIIYAHRNIWDLLDNLKRKNEFNVLQEALRGGVLRTVLFTQTSWESDTKKRIRALYWDRFAKNMENRKKLHYSLASSANKGEYYAEHMEQVELIDSHVLGAREKAKILLGDLPPLGMSEVYSLVTNMIMEVKR